MKTQRAQIPRVRNGGEDDTSLREIAGSVRVMLFLLLEESCDSIRKIHKSFRPEPEPHMFQASAEQSE